MPDRRLFSRREPDDTSAIDITRMGDRKVALRCFTYILHFSYSLLIFYIEKFR